MIEFNFPGYRISNELHKEPTEFELWLEHASFTDVKGLSNAGSPIYIGVGNEGHWFETVIAFRTEQLDTSGFVPGILVVPETQTLFVGAGETIKIYDLSVKTLKLEKTTPFGFWGWSRHDDIIIMSAEIEFVVYSLEGGTLDSLCGAAMDLRRCWR